MTARETLERRIMVARVLSFVFFACGLLLGMAIALFAFYTTTGTIPILQARVTSVPIATIQPTSTPFPVLDGVATPPPYIHPEQYKVVLSDRMTMTASSDAELKTSIISLKKDGELYMNLSVNVGNDKTKQGSRVTFILLKEDAGGGVDFTDVDSTMPITIIGKDNSFPAVAQAFRVAVAEADRLRMYDFYREE